MMTHDLTGVTVAVEARLVGLENGSLDVTGVVFRRRDRCTACPVQREFGRRGSGGVRGGQPRGGGRQGIGGGPLRHGWDVGGICDMTDSSSPKLSCAIRRKNCTRATYWDGSGREEPRICKGTDEAGIGTEGLVSESGKRREEDSE